jgi:hypothetical protein
LIVTMKVPRLSDMLALNVSVLVPVVLAGLKEAVTPFGKPEADKLTELLKPFSLFTVIVLVPVLPRPTLNVFGAAERPKSGAGAEAFTVRLMETV